MYGVAGATGALEKIAAHLGETWTKAIAKQALTQTAIYPLIKKVSKSLGVTMSKKLLGNGVGKAVPVVGGLVSGAITYASFKPMANRLNSYLSKRQKAKARAAKKLTAR